MATKTDDEETSVDEQESTDEEERETVRDPEAVLAANRKLEAENRALRRTLETQGAELKRLVEIEEGSKSDREKEIDAIRKEATQKAEAKWKGLLLVERVTARAARRFRDPEDVVHLIDLDEIDDSPESIDAKLEDLAERKPYLLVSPDEPFNGKVPDADQGARPPATAKTKESPDEWLLGLAGRDS